MPSTNNEPLKTIQVKFPESKKNEIKAYASAHGLTLHQLVLDMFEAYKKQGGGK
jgi:predicted DNA binding CopG/RHH family protein